MGRGTYTNRFILTPTILKTLRARGYIIYNCFRCDVPFEIGDEIVSKGNRGNRYYYHTKCWEDLFIEPTPETPLQQTVGINGDERG